MSSATPISAQTNDPLYRSWRWSPTLGSPRAAGLAGAFVAVADDASASLLNPAGMATLPKTELAGAFVTVGAGTPRPHGDNLESWAGIGFIGGAGRVTPRLAVGGYIEQSRGGVLTLSPDFTAPDGRSFSGSLDAAIIDGGAGLAYKLGERWNVGFRLTATHLELSGAYRRTAGGRVTLESGAAAGHTRVTGSLGVLYETENWRSAFVVYPGASYKVTRTANDVAASFPVDPGSEYEIRSPSAVSGGAAIQVSRKLMLTGQVDYVRYSEISTSLLVRPGAAAVPASDYQLDDGLELRLGAEASVPLSSLSLQLRGGLYSQAPGAVRYSGSDVGEAAVFTGSDRRVLGAVGVTVVTRGLHLDAAISFGGAQTELSAGGRLRF